MKDEKYSMLVGWDEKSEIFKVGLVDGMKD